MPLGSKPCWRETGNLVTVQPDPAQAKPCLHVSPLQNGMLQLTLGPVAFSIFYDEYLWRNCDKSIDPNIFIVGVLWLL